MTVELLMIVGIAIIISITVLVFLEYRKRQCLEEIREESEKMEETIRKLIKKLENQLNS